MVSVINRKVLGTVCLVLATFLNPFGFDILVYKLTTLTNDYWTTMHILYVFSALFFGLSFLSFKLNNINLGNILLMLALFLNPLGYDVLFAMVYFLTKSYLLTTIFFYIGSFIFFCLYMYFYNINPKNSFFNLIRKIKKNNHK